eukprot:scaffold1878_cov258-Pinguiococcus_pyrenoidosus.AAC.8
MRLSPLHPAFLLWLPQLAALSSLGVAQLRDQIPTAAADGGSFRKRSSFLKPQDLHIRFGSSAADLHLRKRPGESVEHVLMKALLWELFRHDYPQLQVEPPAPKGSRFVPDLICHRGTEENGIAFWGECGKTDLAKIVALAEEHPATLLVVAKYRIALQGYAASVRRELGSAVARREKPVMLVAFPDDSLDRFFGEDGTMRINKDEELLQWASLGRR